MSINVGLLGLGRLGRVYARYFRESIASARLIAVADVDETRAREVAEELEISQWYSAPDAVIERSDIDAVVIATPTRTHREIIDMAAASGKAIFCEKPLSLSLEEASAIQRTVETSGVFFQMGFMRRFDKGYRAAKDRILKGAIGTPVLFRATSRDPARPSLEFADPKNSGGMITDMGIHDVDLARWFMGDAATVYAIGGTLAYPELKEIDDIDNAVISIGFRDGRLGVIDLSRNGVYGYDISTEIVGTEGTLRVGYLRDTPLLVMTRNNVSHDVVPFFIERFERAYVDQLRDFVDNVNQQRRPGATIADGVEALRVCAAADKSRRSGSPVPIPLQCL